nr:hypothetical protein [Mycobacterium eburneum]
MTAAFERPSGTPPDGQVPGVATSFDEFAPARPEPIPAEVTIDRHVVKGD